MLIPDAQRRIQHTQAGTNARPVPEPCHCRTCRKSILGQLLLMTAPPICCRAQTISHPALAMRDVIACQHTRRWSPTGLHDPDPDPDPDLNPKFNANANR